MLFTKFISPDYEDYPVFCRLVISTKVDFPSAKTFMKLLSTKAILLCVMSDCCDVSAFMIYPKMFLKSQVLSSKLIENSLKVRSNKLIFGMISEKDKLLK